MNTRKIIVLPIMYRNCNIPLFLADRKYADFRTDYHQGFIDLCRALGLKRTDSITASNWRTFMTDKSANWKQYREDEFKELVTSLVDHAKKYNWSCWIGGTKNPLAITFSARLSHEQRKYISIRLAKGTYMAADSNEINPNNIRPSEYTIYVGNTVNECEEYVFRQMDAFHQEFGDPTGEAHYFTQRFLSNQEKVDLIQDIIQRTDWYQRK